MTMVHQSSCFLRLLILVIVLNCSFGSSSSLLDSFLARPLRPAAATATRVTAGSSSFGRKQQQQQTKVLRRVSNNNEYYDDEYNEPEDVEKKEQEKQTKLRKEFDAMKLHAQEQLKEKQEEIKRGVESRLGGYRPYQMGPSRGKLGSVSVTSKLVTANVCIFALQTLFPVVTQWGIKRSDLILQGKQWHRLVTPMFLHGSVSHLLLNSFSLSNIGPEVEKIFGTGRYLGTYLVAGICGNVASAIRTPNPSLGASGAVFGCMGAYYACLNRNTKFFGQSGQRAMGSIGTTLTMNIVFGLATPHVDNWGHIGGGIGGALMALYFGPKLYVLGLPTGGRIIVDKPAVRLPKSLETVPNRIIEKLRQGKVRMQVNRFQSDLTVKPWRPNKWKRRRIHRPQHIPIGPRQPRK